MKNSKLSREIADQYKGKIFEDIKAMSKKELQLILHGTVCRVMLIEQEWKNRESFSKQKDKISECPNITKLFHALEDYRYLSLFDDCKVGVDSKRESSKNLGNVYVIEFDDSSVKIGMSTTPEQRIKSIVGGNQSKKLRDWISPTIDNFQKLEHKAHNHFSIFRLGGEFFSVSFDDAVNWLAGEIAKSKIDD